MKQLRKRVQPNIFIRKETIRPLIADALRKQGATAKEVGKRLNISPSMAYRLAGYGRALRDRGLPSHEFDVLSKRVANILRAEGFNTKAQVERATELHKAANCGRNAMMEIEQWLHGTLEEARTITITNNETTYIIERPLFNLTTADAMLLMWAET